MKDNLLSFKQSINQIKLEYIKFNPSEKERIDKYIKNLETDFNKTI